MRTSIEWAAGCADGREGHSINPFRARLKDRGWRVSAGNPDPLVGHHCVKISPGCANCYASELQKRFRMPDFGSNRWRWAEPLVELFLDESKLQEVLRRRKPTGYFWCDMTDMFLDEYPNEWIDKCFAVMEQTSQHIHMVLTKRPERMHRYVTEDRNFIHIKGERLGGLKWPLPNVYLGVSTENQKYADERIPPLLDTPAAIRFVSYEPALGPIDIKEILLGMTSCHRPDWLIFGGESGPNARPCNIQWARDVRDQCKAAGTAFFLKQMGARPYEDMGFDDLHYLRFKDRKGGDPAEWPEEDRVREFPR